MWLDNFSSNKLNEKALNEFLQQGKNVVLVSPELHGYEYKSYWADLLECLGNNPEYTYMVGLCTDKPIDAKEFFIDVG